MKQQRKSRSWQRQRIGMLCQLLSIDKDLKRDMLITGFGVRSTVDLTFPQANELLDRLIDEARSQGKWKGKRQRRATRDEVKRLRYHAIACALHYAEMPPFRTESGDVLHGAALRAWALRIFEQGRRTSMQTVASVPLPKHFLRHLSSTWINPVSNRWLLDAGWRAKVKDMSRCFFESLKEDEVRHLINRFREMHRTIEQQSGDISVPYIDPSQVTISEN